MRLLHLLDAVARKAPPWLIRLVPLSVKNCIKRTLAARDRGDTGTSQTPPVLERLRHRWELPASEPARREAAQWAYRTILLREPESDQALDFLSRNSGSAKAMRDLLLQSAEVRAQPGFPVIFPMTGDEPPQPVQSDVLPEQRERLFRRVQTTWQLLGEQKPHWSVATVDAFQPGRIDGALDDFYATGEANVATLMRTLERNGINPARIQTCMDFGCGVGRLSVALASRFAQVVSVDVSASHLAVAREAFARRGITNASIHHLETIGGLAALPFVDLIYSLIVLQHNPPPVIKEVLQGLLGRLNPGGVAVIQIPTYLPAGYRFDFAEYERRASGDMEMHALPQRDVFKVARDEETDVLEVMEDAWTGFGFGSRSNTFVLRRAIDVPG
jgi:SAM-dependent methyltransferase